MVRGEGFGACRKIGGEVVFNTGMAGYSESLTDPSYNGQILMSTYPLIGNYKVHPEWYESDQIWAEGFIVREACEKPSHWKGEKSIDEFLKEFNIPGISEIDTRALTTKIRKFGVMKGTLVTYENGGPEPKELVIEAKEHPSTSEIDLVAETTREKNTTFNEGGKPEIVLIDCGVKRSIINSLTERGAEVTAIPAETAPEQISELDPDGILLSNGPGDPALIDYVIKNVEKILPDYPIMGICLGHQLLALAAGGETFKLKFGHRGINQPVKDLETGRTHITSQNHGFAVDPESLENTGFEITQLNSNDGTSEGMRHKDLPVFSVQYHPEAGPGPYDCRYVFDKFLEMVREY